MEYLATSLQGALSFIFVVFAIIAAGCYIGKFEIKGISLGTAGVLLVALLYGILSSVVPEFKIGETGIVLFDDAIKSKYSTLSGLGTVLFVSSVGLMAGPKFFRSFNKSFLAYLVVGVVTIVAGALLTLAIVMADRGISTELAVGLMTGALTSTPGLAAAKEVAADADAVTAGYGIAYLFGVIGVVFFVQIMPKLLHVDIQAEKKKFVAAGNIAFPEMKQKVSPVEPNGFFPLALTISLGCVLGAFKIPGIGFSLGNSGGCLIVGLLIGHIRSVSGIDLRINAKTIGLFRELGLIMFLVGAGVPGGVNFMNNIKLSYFIYGVLITLVPMIVGYYVAVKIFKLDIFNALGSITGGMTSTPALGALIRTADTEEVAASYAATYPIALVMVVICSKILLLVV